jgi:hypothetical protein
MRRKLGRSRFAAARTGVERGAVVFEAAASLRTEKLIELSCDATPSSRQEPREAG